MSKGGEPTRYDIHTHNQTQENANRLLTLNLAVLEKEASKQAFFCIQICMSNRH